MIFELAYSKPLIVKEIAEKCDITYTQAMQLIELAIKEHYYKFGTKPINLIYDPNNGFVATATSSIGKIYTDYFDIQLTPKIEGIEISKCLLLAHSVKMSNINICKNEIVKDYISDEQEYTIYDLLAFGLIDAVFDIKNNGLIRKFEDITISAIKIKGQVNFTSSIAKGNLKIRPDLNEISPTYQTLPNQIIKYALDLCKINTDLSEITKLINVVDSEFRFIPPLNQDIIKLLDFRFFYNLPRPDYENAIKYAAAIIQGNIFGNNSDIDIPSFTLNLDLVFEQYVSHTIKKLLNPKFYKVYLQKEYEHPISPKPMTKNIVPDIVVENLKNGKKIILDVKNKYSNFNDQDQLSANNNDLFQITYYAKALNSKNVILVFPHGKSVHQCPIKASESEVSYNTKIEKYMNNCQQYVFFDNEINLSQYFINLSGTLHNTEKSVASLCKLITILIG